jgi:hypothetical protein
MKRVIIRHVLSILSEIFPFIMKYMMRVLREKKEIIMDDLHIHQ